MIIHIHVHMLEDVILCVHCITLQDGHVIVLVDIELHKPVYYQVDLPVCVSD